MISHRLVFLGVVAIIGVIAAACDGGGPSDEEVEGRILSALDVNTTTEQETAYLSGVRTAFDSVYGRNAAVREVFSQQHATTSAFFGALESRETAASFALVLERVQELAIPQAYESDHGRLLTYLQESVRLDGDLDRAIAAQDVVAFMLTNPLVDVLGITIYLELSPSLCNVVARGAFRALCRSSELPGGVYGAAVAELVGQTAANVLPRATGPVGLLDPASQFAALERLQADILETLEQMRSDLAALEAPPELRSDHARLQQVLDDLSATFQALYQATGDEDISRFVMESEQVVRQLCAAAGEFSPAYRPLVRPLFESPSTALAQRPGSPPPLCP